MAGKEALYEALSQGQMEKVRSMVQESLDAGESPDVILRDGLISAMERIGVMFKNGEIYIPEVLIAARAMHAGLAVLKPVLSTSDSKAAEKIVIGTVKGDVHDIGKNLVIMMLEGAGYEVIDLGMDVSYEKFVESIRTNRPAILGMCALLTTTMTEMKKTIQFIAQEGLREQVKIIVGGAPVTEKFARDIGADGYGADAASAVDLVKHLLEQRTYPCREERN